MNTLHLFGRLNTFFQDAPPVHVDDFTNFKLQSRSISRLILALMER